ncbi:MAG: inorganic diphosphatase [Tissierellia bacterium]|nr:inorganic diphosphatase [Tissierellia bacterium]
MNIWHDMEDSRIGVNKFMAVIEIGKKGNVKYELDKKTGMLLVDRVLYTSTHYPANYGFIPRTYAKDDDPLDVLVLCSETLLPMSLVEVKPIGVLIMVDSEKPDEKIIGVPTADPEYADYESIEELPTHISKEISHFFRVYKELEGKETAVKEVYGVEEAKKIIQEAMDHYQEKFV